MGDSDSSFFRNFSIVLSVLIVISVGVYVLAQSVSEKDKLPRKVSDANIVRVSDVDVVAKEKKPVVNVAAKVMPRAKTPEELGVACLACHKTGAAQAPKLTSKEDWAARAKKSDVDAMVKTVIKGKKGMPPKGGTTLSDAEIKQVVEYMLKQAGVSK